MDLTWLKYVLIGIALGVGGTVFLYLLAKGFFREIKNRQL